MIGILPPTMILIQVSVSIPLLALFLHWTDGFQLLPMPCNVSLTNSCPAVLYFVPDVPKTIQQTAALFRVPPYLINQTVDGFLITVTCECPADHDQFVWRTPYTIRPGDSWPAISREFSMLVDEKLDKVLFPTTTITLSFLCGCVSGLQLVTYTIKPGDTLYTICSKFQVDMDETTKLNKVRDVTLIHAGDKLFIPSAGLQDLVTHGTGNLHEKKSPGVLIIIAPVVCVLLLSCAVLLWFFYRKKIEQVQDAPSLKQPNRSGSLKAPLHASKSTPPVIISSQVHKGFETSRTSSISVKATVFAYSEICAATSNFSASQKIGQGSYGCVYHGCLRGVGVAIKQMKNTKSKEFFAELNILCKVHHNNLIELLGYSAGAESLFLVYEFAKNGALSNHLHGCIKKGTKPLSWGTRVRIALDAAKGLEYIHAHIKPFCVHRDVKTSNILLDSHFRAKIADFGLVKLLEGSQEFGASASVIVGTFGYLAPEYVRDGYVTSKNDVYAFGVVLMELITGRPVLSRNKKPGSLNYEHQSLVDTMLSTFDDSKDFWGKLAEIVDPSLTDYNQDSLLKMALLSKNCVEDDWRNRPDMSQVALRLCQVAFSLEQGKTNDVHA